MKQYTVKELAKLSGISVRTLHHYDNIGLLPPASRSEKGYRYYGRDELLLLQQILLYKELGFSLETIGNILHDPDFDLLSALEEHKVNLQLQRRHLSQLVKTVDKTIAQLKNLEMMTDEELYEGFTREEADKMREEVTERWGEKQLLKVEEKIRSLSKDEWKDHKEKGEAINQLLADLMEFPPDHEKVVEAIRLHHEHMNFYYETSSERYLGLANMYVEDERFTAYYDNYKKGLAEFILQAVTHYCSTL